MGECTRSTNEGLVETTGGWEMELALAQPSKLSSGEPGKTIYYSRLWYTNYIIVYYNIIMAYHSIL